MLHKFNTLLVLVALLAATSASFDLSVFELFGELVRQGKTIVMVTHDRELAGQIPRVEEVRDGLLVGAGQVDARLASRN